MSRVGKNIYKRKDGRWEGRYIKDHENGKARYASVYGHSCKETKLKLDEAKRELAGKANKLKAGKVESLGEIWLDEISTSLKISSINKYEDILINYIFPKFGNVELSNITNENLISFANELLNHGGMKKQGLSPSMVNQIISAMNCLRICALRKNCAVNFTTECVTIKMKKKEIRVFSVEEEKRLIDYLIGHYDLTALGILLCLFSGLRVGEITALTWDDFDFESGTFSITKTMQRIRIKNDSDKKTEVRILEPKSKCSVRIIPIPKNLNKLLLSEYVKGAFVLNNSKFKYVEPRTLQNRFKSILKKAGISEANFHTTRHTFATRCIEQGTDIKCLSEILGHASVSITLNRYVHPSMELKTENMAKLTRRFPISV